MDVQGIFNERSSIFPEKRRRVTSGEINRKKKITLIWKILVFPTSDTEKIKNNLYRSIRNAHLQPGEKFVKELPAKLGGTLDVMDSEDSGS